MSTPEVVYVRDIPVIIDRSDKMFVGDSGFPFDRDDFSSRPNDFRSRLDDIAQRHPEFAEHLQEFPFRSRLNQQRNPTTDFRSHFDRRFPFDDYFDYPHQQPHEQSQPTQSAEPSHSAQPAQTTEPRKPDDDDKQQQQRGRKVQQSNTVDLGQKQQEENCDLVNERQQRSMSAPPSETRQRFVSSINIPINPTQEQRPPSRGTEEMGQSKSANPQEKQAPNRPQERVIPILVEGRDEPVMPKTYAQQQQQAPPPQAERIFGQRPEQFTQFVQKPRVEEDLLRQQQEYKRQQEQKFQQQQQEQQQQEQQPKAAPQPKTPIDLIQNIKKNVNELMLQVEQFKGKPRDKQYLYLDEMLTQNLLKLDDIDTQGQENIRTSRKEAIKWIEKCLGLLEAKALANVGESEQGTSGEKMETVSGDVEKATEGEEKMDVEADEKSAEGVCKEGNTDGMEVGAEGEKSEEKDKAEETQSSESQTSEEKHTKNKSKMKVGEKKSTAN